VKAVSVGIFQGYGPNHTPIGLNTGDNTNAGAIYKDSGIRHASIYGPQVCLLALAARAALGSAESRIEPRRALVTNGGPWAADTALGFLRTSQERGPRFVNPLVFPATLVSAGAAAVGVVVGAGACAIAVGHDELAFFEMLRRSQQFLCRGIAQEVIAAVACAPSVALATSLESAGLITPAGECSLALRLENDPQAPFVLEDATITTQAPPLAEEAILVDAQVTAQGLVECEGWDLGQRPLLSAVGGVLCAWALHRHLTDAPAGTALVVRCHRNGVVGAARFRRQ
jgi:hypothetical protein